jgi:hypothetical protein
VADQTLKTHAKYCRKESQDAGESVHLYSLLPTVEVSGAGGTAVGAEAAPNGVPELPYSADWAGACQRHCDEGGTLAHSVSADLMGKSQNSGPHP